MKTRNQILVLVLLSLFLISPYLKPIRADNPDMIQIINPAVQPLTIKVGDTFSINATIVNKSNDTISVHNDCSGAFSVAFDNHATSGLKKVCNFMAIQVILQPGENTTVSSQNSVLGFTAVSAGTVNATVTASYIVGNKTGQSMSFDGNPINITKSFLFDISNQTVPTPSAIEHPLEQFKSGIAAKDVKCQAGLELVIKTEDGSPACVRQQTALGLVERGWGAFATQPT